jgi:hypothetical protein
MTRIERWGMELAENIRREEELTQELDKVRAEIDETLAKIKNAPAGALHESTSEVTLVRPFIPSVAAEDPGETVRLLRPEMQTMSLRLVPEDDTAINLAGYCQCTGPFHGTGCPLF